MYHCLTVTYFSISKNKHVQHISPAHVNSITAKSKRYISDENEDTRKTSPVSHGPSVMRIGNVLLNNSQEMC